MTKFRTALSAILAGVVLLGGALATASPASAKTDDTKTVTWLLPAGQTPQSAFKDIFPQTIVTNVQDVPCDRWLQVDVYRYKKSGDKTAVDTLIAGGVLVWIGGNQASDSHLLIDGGLNTAWFFTYTGECQPTTTTTEVPTTTTEVPTTTEAPTTTTEPPTTTTEPEVTTTTEEPCADHTYVGCEPETTVSVSLVPPTSVVMPNCDQLGRTNILSNDPDFNSGLDADGDGVGCEDGAVELAYTGGPFSVSLALAGAALLGLGALLIVTSKRRSA